MVKNVYIEQVSLNGIKGSNKGSESENAQVKTVLTFYVKGIGTIIGVNSDSALVHSLGIVSKFLAI
jgi:hypothetical protein